MNGQKIRSALQLIVGAGVYFVAARIGLSWEKIEGGGPAMWPATGLALAGLLLYGRRFWPCVLLGGFLAYWQGSGHVWIAAATAIGNMLEAVLGALLVQRLAGGLNVFETVPTILRFVLCAGISTALGATIGTTSRWGGATSDYGHLWFIWWLGNLISDLTATPALLLWLDQGMPGMERKTFFKAVAMIVSVTLVGEIVFGGWTDLHITYLCIPLLVWAAFSFYQWGAATAILILSIIALRGAMRGFLPFTAPDRETALVLLQVYMGTISLTSLVLGTLARERKQLQDRFKSVAQFPEENPNPVLRLAQSGRVLYANHAASELLASISGTPQKEVLRAEVQKRLGEGRPKTFELQIAERIYSIFSVPVAARGYVNFYARDLTDSKRAEAGMAQARARLEGVISSAMDGIIAVDSSQRIILFNGAAEKMFGVPASEAMGKPLNMFLPQRYREAHTHHVEKFGDTGVSARRMGGLGQVSGLRRNGEEFPIEASISQTEAGGEKVYTVILRDITQRVKSEEALRLARWELALANEALEQKVQERTAKLQEALNELQHFSYTITHDMRAPLRAMQGLSQILLDEAESCLIPEHQEHLRRIVVASERLDNLIRDALNYSVLAQGQFELSPVDVDGLLREIIQSYPGLQAPRVKIEIAGPLPPVIGNKAGLTQCFASLLRNAVKFSKLGQKPAIRIWAEERGEVVRLWFADNGIGIAPEYQEKIFEMFQQLDPSAGGTGIGLALVKKAAERMDGRVGVESAFGEGSRFWLEFKTATAPASA